MESKVTGANRGLVLVPCPFQGHINPMIQLASLLHARGFSITIAHPELNFPDPSKHPDFKFAMLPCNQNIPGDTSPRGLNDILFSVNNDCAAPFQALLSKMIEEGGGMPCVIHDVLIYFPEAVANQLSLPSIRLYTSSATFSLAHEMLPKLLEEGLIPPENSSLLNPVPEIHHLRFKDLPIANYDNLDAVLQYLAATNSIRAYSAIIWNTMDFLEETSLAQLQKLCGVPFFTIGPVHKLSLLCYSPSASLLREDTSCIEWLNKQAPNSVIYVSMGSLASLTDEEAMEMAWGLANSEQPFLWVLRPGLIRESKWEELLESGFKEKIRERGWIVNWAPQREVLTHKAVGGFWSHGGWNSILESISEGVPLICRPSFADQITNANFLSRDWKIVMVLEGKLERREIERTVRSLMVDEEGMEVRQRSMKLKEKIQWCIQDGGSSSSSLNELVKLILSL